jgi:hypothetical protein
LLSLFYILAQAQSTGKIKSVIKDESGNNISSATVTFLDLQGTSEFFHGGMGNKY